MRKYLVKSFLTLMLIFNIVPSLAFSSEAFERIIKKGEIRCGFGVSDPWVYYDFENNKVKGLAVDLSEAIAKQLSLKLVWGEETGWANLPTSLYNGRVDLACSTLWNDPSKVSQITYTDPIWYNLLYAYVRQDDNRFTSIDDLNQPDIVYAVQDGGFSVDLAHKKFNKTKLHETPQFSPWTDLFQNVADGKADFMIADELSIQNFNKNNKKKLKRVMLDEPIAVYGTSYAVSIKEQELFHMINNVVKYMIQSGDVERITEEFRQKYPDVILLPNKPYQIIAK